MHSNFPQILLFISLLSICCLPDIEYPQRGRQESYIDKNLYETGIKENIAKLSSGKQEVFKETYRQLMILCRKESEFLRTISIASACVSKVFYDLRIEKNQIGRSKYIYYYKGLSEFVSGDYESAVTSFVTFLKKSPNDINGQAWLGAGYFKKGDIVKARTIWRSLKDSEAGNLTLIFMSAFLHDNAGTLNISAVKANKNDPEALQKDLLLTLISKNQAKNRGIRLILEKTDFKNPDYLENVGAGEPIDYFDPVKLQVISMAYSYLSFFYANMFNTLADISEQVKNESQYYRAQYYYDAAKFDKVIETLSESSDIKSACLKIASDYASGRNSKAEKDLADFMEKWKSNGEATYALGYAAIRYGFKDKVDYKWLLNEAFEKVKISTRNEYKLKKYYFAYGLSLIIDKDYQQSYKILQEGLSMSHYTLDFNPPEYLSLFCAAIVLSEHFNYIESECILPLNLLGGEYECSRYLSSPLIKIVTLIKTRVEIETNTN